MLEVRGIQNGIVIDHIKAGNGIKLFNKLMSNKTKEASVLLMNVESKALGKKDIIKLENVFEIDLNLLGLIDKNITVSIIRDAKVVEKKTAQIPMEVRGLFPCNNVRCITNSDSYAETHFKLYDSNGSAEYICEYCEEITKYKL